MDGFEKRSLLKKELVLDTAFNLMNSELGANGLTVDKVVEDSGISKATIFKYFGSKQNLIQQVFVRYMKKLQEDDQKIMEEPLNFEDRYMALARLKVHYFEKVNQQFFVSLMDYYTQNGNDEFGTLMQQYTEDSFGTFQRIIAQGRTEGKIDPKYSDDFLMVYMKSMIKGATDPEIYKKIDIDYTEDWTEMFLKALAPNPEKH